MITPLLKRHWPLLAIGVLLMVVALYVMGSQKQLLEASFFSDLTPGEGLKLKNVSYTQDDPHEGTRWVLDAREVIFSKDKTFVTFTDFQLRLAPRDRPRVRLEGKRGDYDRESGEINLHGDLRAYTDNGYSIVTEHMLYKEKEGYLETEESVRLYGPFFSVAGKGLYFHPKKQTLRIISDVTTRIDEDSSIL